MRPSAVVYLETNFIVGAAKGQDLHVDALFKTGKPIAFKLPAICCMEALSTLEHLRKQTARTMDTLKELSRDAKKDQSSTIAARWVGHIEKSRIDANSYQNQVQQRMLHLLGDLAGRVELIPLDTRMLLEHLYDPVVPDPTDNLILTCIEFDAGRADPAPYRALLSGDRKAFESSDARRLLDRFAIRHFSSTESIVSWLGSLPI
jgi:hypothetical protein